MSSGELQRIRFHLLNFFQDARVRVCIFLRQQLQNSDGSFVIPTSNCMIAHGKVINIRIFVYNLIEYFELMLCSQFFLTD